MNRFDRPFLRRGMSVSWLFWLLFFAHLANAAPQVPVGPGATFGDTLRSLTVQPASPGTIWLGMSHGGLYRSQNRGTWQTVGPGGG